MFLLKKKKKKQDFNSELLSKNGQGQIFIGIGCNNWDKVSIEYFKCVILLNQTP